MRHVQRLQHFFFVYLLHLPFHHHDGVLLARHDDIHVAFRRLLHGRVDDERVVHPRYAHLCDGAFERRPGEHQRGGRAHARKHVGVILVVGGNYVRDNLRLVQKAVREQRAKRPVHQPRRQDLLVRRAAFPFNESARNFPPRRKFFAILHGKGKKALPLPHVFRNHSGAQHHGVAQPNHGRSACLPRKTARLQREDFARRQFDFFVGKSCHLFFFLVFVQ